MTIPCRQCGPTFGDTRLTCPECGRSTGAGPTPYAASSDREPITEVSEMSKVDGRSQTIPSSAQEADPKLNTSMEK